MSHPYRVPSDRSDAPGPRWGATLRARLFVRWVWWSKPAWYLYRRAWMEYQRQLRSWAAEDAEWKEWLEAQRKAGLTTGELRRMRPRLVMPCPPPIPILE